MAKPILVGITIVVLFVGALYLITRTDSDVPMSDLPDNCRHGEPRFVFRDEQNGHETVVYDIICS